MSGDKDTTIASGNKPSYTSILLKQQEALFKILDPRIKTTISPDGHTLVASNISESAIINIRLITNNAANNARLHFNDIQVYLENDLQPTTVYGFLPICLENVEIADVNAFIADKTTYQPFINGFQDGISVNQLCDKLSAYSEGSPDTINIVKHYTVVLGNDDFTYGTYIPG